MRNLILSGILSVLLVSVHVLGNTDVLFSDTVHADAFTSGKWLMSNDPKYIDQPVLVKPPSTPAPGFEEDTSFVLSEPNKHYGFGTSFTEPISVSGGLVVQYELKLEETLKCGGAYIKLLRQGSIQDLTSETPYTIMFGPDRCGSTNKVHFIVQYLNPFTEVYEEKHFNETVVMKVDKHTHLYTLEIKPDDTFYIYIDKKEVKKGSLLTHMVPSINPSEMTEDPNDVKPEDWVDDEKIVDPEASKPDDWDESAPKMIADPKAIKPEGWLDDAPLKINDPSAVKPDDWDDDEDGLWEAPLIDNPECTKIGCGEWKARLIKNPAYKGPWTAPTIANPAYKGKWSPQLIPNPAYFYHENPSSKLAPITGLAVEIWTITAGIIMDNFVISRSLNAAFEFAANTSDLKIQAEKDADRKTKKETKKKELNEKKAEASSKTDLKEKILAYLPAYLEEVKDLVTENPWAILSCFLALALVLIVLLPKGKKQVNPKPTTSAETPLANDTDDKQEIQYMENPMKRTNGKKVVEPEPAASSETSLPAADESGDVPTDEKPVKPAEDYEI